MLRCLVLILFYFWAIANVNDSLMFLGLYVAIPSSFFLSFFCKKDKVFNNTYVITFCLLFGWIALTWFTAGDFEIATTHMQRLAGVFMMTIAVCNMATDERNVPWLYGLYIFMFCTAVYYAYTHILTFQFDIASNRLDDDRLNANVLANYTFYATFALFVMGEILNKRILCKIFKIVFLLMIPLSFIIALFTASRQVLLVQIPLIVILLYLRYLRSKTLKMRFVFIIGVVVCAVFSLDIISETYDNSFLKTRNEKNIEEDGRFKVLQEAIEVGRENPIVGVGPGNFILHSSDRIFSHCSYTEVFANNGVIGLILYVFLVGYFIGKQFQYFRRTRKTSYLIFLTFGFVFAFHNFLYVFYSDIWLMSFFMFVAMNSCAVWNLQMGIRRRIRIYETNNTK